MNFILPTKAFRYICHLLRGTCSKLSTSVCHYKVVPKNLKNRKKSSQDWLTRHLNDPYVKLAKYDNYRARSAYKLIEIDEKCKLLQPGLVVLECGAAPGAWTQVIVPRINSNNEVCDKPVGEVIAADILPFAIVEGAVMLPNCDFTSQNAQQLIRDKLKGRKVDLVLSDMAPNATGSRELDHECIMALASSALEFAVANSRQGSHFLCKVSADVPNLSLPQLLGSGRFDRSKIWQGYRTEQFLKQLQEFYSTTKVIKPNASRSESSEIFLLARSMKS